MIILKKENQRKKKTSNNMGLAESINYWKVREKGGDKLTFYPKAPEL